MTADFITLAFARSHDWGQGAYLEDGRIHGLIDAYALRNPETGEVTYHEDEASVPATMTALRKFGNY
jgi:hypothetical protein